MGSANIQGEIWGARARDWANYAEATSTDIFNSVLNILPFKKGVSFLDIGCGSGAFCKMVSERGADVSGFDASTALLEIARERVPNGDFKTGDMEKLPYPDSQFDIITGLNSFQFAENKVNALSEAKRVAKSGAKIMILVWGNPEECESTGIMRAIGSLWEAPKQSAQPPLFQAGVIESLAEAAGLTTEISDELLCTWHIPDKDSVLRGVLSAGLSTLAIRHSGEDKVRAAVSDAITPYRQPDGSYKFRNKFRYVIGVTNKAS